MALKTAKRLKIAIDSKEFRQELTRLGYELEIVKIKPYGELVADGDREIMDYHYYVDNDLHPFIEAVKNRVSGCLTFTRLSKQSKIEFRDVFDC